MRRLTRDEARRIAIRAQLLDAARPHDLLSVVDQLTFLQLDPTAAIAPSADLVAWTRLGNDYQPAHLTQALERDRTLFEHRGQVLHHDRLVGKVDATADRGSGRLVVHAVHRDVVFTRAMTAAVDNELKALPAWLDLQLVRS